MTFDELMQLEKEMFLVFQDAFKRDDIEIGHKMVKLMEFMNNQILAIHLRNISEAIQGVRPC